MAAVLIDRPLHEEALSLLSSQVEVVSIFDDNREKLEEAIKRVEGIICSAALKIGQREIGLGKNLKVLGRPGVGYDSVDIKAATEAGIPVVYTPDGPTESVAEHVIGMMILLAKRINLVEKAFREKGDFGIRTRVTGTELMGKTLGLVGAGRIGRRTAEIAGLGLKMNILLYDPYLKAGSLKVPWEYRQVSDLEELLGESDFVSLHVPATPETRKLIGEAQLKKMKKTAYLINTARGSIVDEPALVEALKTGVIAGAGLDVFEKEPPDKDNPLLTLDNLVLTPHLSSFTEDGKRKMGVTVVEGVLDVLKGRKPEFLVNPEVWNRRR